MNLISSNLNRRIFVRGNNILQTLLLKVDFIGSHKLILVILLRRPKKSDRVLFDLVYRIRSQAGTASLFYRNNDIWNRVFLCSTKLFNNNY